MFENINAKQLHIYRAYGRRMDRLLHLRSKQWFETEHGQQISRAVCAYLQIRNLNMGKRPPPHEEFWFMNERDYIPYQRAMSSISRICPVNVAAEELLKSIDNSPLDDSGASLSARCAALTGLAGIQSINNEHWLWVQSASDSWSYRCVNIPYFSTKLRHYLAAGVYIYYKSMELDSCFMLYPQVCHQMFNEAVLYLVESTAKLGCYRGKCLNNQMICNICANVPFLMGDIDS